jgi:hypothetical protein
MYNVEIRTKRQNPISVAKFSCQNNENERVRYIYHILNLILHTNNDKPNWKTFHLCCVRHFTLLYCITLYCTVLYCTVLHCTALYCTLPYHTALHSTVLYCTLINVLFIRKHLLFLFFIGHFSPYKLPTVQKLFI